MKKVMFMAICAIVLVACVSTNSQKTPYQDDLSEVISLPDSVSRIGDTNLYIVCEKGQYGVKNDTGLVVVPSIYDAVSYVPPFFVVNRDNLEGVIDMQGQVIVEPQYSGVIVCQKLLCVSDNGPMAAYTHQGKRLTDFAYYTFEECAKVFVAEGDDGKHVFSYSGKKILPTVAKSVDVYEDYIYPQNDTEGEPRYKESMIFYQNYHDKWGMISLEGRPSVEAEYDELFRYGEYYLGRKFQKYQALDLNADVVTDFYNDVEPTGNGFIVENDGYYGFLSLDNKVLLDIKYQQIMVLSNNLLWVKKDVKQVGLYEQSGKEILPPIYDEIWEDDIYGTSLHVEYKGKLGVWDDNMFIIPLLFDDIYLFRYGSKKYWSVVKDGKHGLLRENSRTIFSPKYSSISYCTHKDNKQEIDFVVSVGDKFQRYSSYGKYIENIKDDVYFKVDADSVYPWEQIRQDSLLYNNAYLYEVRFSDKK